MRILGAILNTIDSISEWSGRIIIFLLPIVVLEMTYEVVVRYGFNAPTEWSYEVTIFGCGTIIIIGGAYTLLHKGHVNVDLVYSHLSLRRKAILDLISSVLFFLYVGVLVWLGGKIGVKSVMFFEHSDSLWAPPLYFFKMALPVGASLLLLQGLAKFIRDLATAVTGREEIFQKKGRRYELR